MLEHALDVPEVPTVIEFCDKLLERQISLFEEYKNQFVNIYRKRVSEYFKKAPSRPKNIKMEQNMRYS